MASYRGYSSSVHDTPRDDDDDETPVPSAPKLLKLWVTYHHTSFDVEPEDYLGAIAELLFLTICGSFVITFVANRQFLDDNPIKNMVGYNNPCVFWDEPPALYFAALMFCPMIYFAFQYAHFDSARAKLDEDHRSSMGPGFGNMCCMVNLLYAASQMLLMGIFVIRPKPHSAGHSVSEMNWYMRAHSACFLQFVPVLCITMTSNYIEGWKSGVPSQKPSATGWVILIVYIVATALETVFATYAIFSYKGNYDKIHREKSFQVNPILMQIIDYCWFLSLPLAGAFQPSAPNIEFAYKLKSDHNYDHVPVDEDSYTGDADAAYGDYGDNGAYGGQYPQQQHWQHGQYGQYE